MNNSQIMVYCFSITATIPSSLPQELQVSGTCLESSLYMFIMSQCQDLQIYMSANGKSKFVSLADEQLFSTSFDNGALRFCFTSSNEFHNIFGDVKEVFVQEVCVIDPNELCGDPESHVGDSYLHIFGSRGRIPLPFNQTGLFHGILVSVFVSSWCIIGSRVNV